MKRDFHVLVMNTKAILIELATVESRAQVVYVLMGIEVMQMVNVSIMMSALASNMTVIRWQNVLIPMARLNVHACTAMKATDPVHFFGGFRDFLNSCSWS